ncbi:hypothetical protein F53441_6483 [Fusarium austroafricanum]|uniref:DUF6604 domain-containing protein n=1 Tax=Fusarium austroafricanum TaxID=2364996 RepID=A0A8H4NTA0_9HYPO|nr:hypothetical protein F53441_6483 [Fusarium austroafricanum]
MLPAALVACTESTKKIPIQSHHGLLLQPESADIPAISYPAPLLSISSKNAKGGRPKGKARGGGKKKGKKPAKKTPDNSRYIIEIKDFISLAEYLSAYERTFSVPRAFFSTLNRVIRAQLYDTLSFCYYYTASILDALAPIPWEEVSGIHPEGIFGVCDSETAWEAKSNQQKLIEDRVIISELWYETLLLENVPDYPCTDEFIRGVREFKETKKIPFSLVFAAQVNLDIHHCVGDYAESSVSTLLKQIASMHQILKSYREFQEDIIGPHWDDNDQIWLQSTKEGFEWFLNDPLHRVKTLVVDNDQKGLESLSRTEKWRLLRRSPVIAGLALHYHRAELHKAGLKVTNA